jgi:hypothetical protein
MHGGIDRKGDGFLTFRYSAFVILERLSARTSDRAGFPNICSSSTGTANPNPGWVTARTHVPSSVTLADDGCPGRPAFSHGHERDQETVEMLPLYLVAFAIRHQLIIEHKRLYRFLVVLVRFHFVFFLKKNPTLYIIC